MSIRDIAASVLAVPEVTADVLGQAFDAVADMFEALEARVEDLEEKLRGET